MPTRPNIDPPNPRTALRPIAELDTELAEPRRHRSVSSIAGEVRFLDGSDDEKDLGPIVVYLVPHERDDPPGSDVNVNEAAPVVVTSRTAEFSPALAGVSRGQRIVLANEGPLAHGLFSADVGNTRFDLPPGTRSLPFAIPPQGPVRFFCALHADETFVVFAGDVRHLAVVDAGRPYSFDHVDPGRYTLTIWSERVEGPVRDVVADGYTHVFEPVWLDPELVRRSAGPEGQR